MNADEIEASIDKYNELKDKYNHETLDRNPSLAEMNYLERQMAKIEECFQRAGLDINDYL